MTAAPLHLPRPTDAELEILRVLWERGDSTVREVQEALESKRPTGYTTVLKQLQIMTEKGLVRRDASERAHVYRARLAREATESQLVGDLLGGWLAIRTTWWQGFRPAHCNSSGSRARAFTTSSGKSISVHGRPLISSNPKRSAALARIMSRIGSSYSIIRRPPAT